MSSFATISSKLFKKINTLATPVNTDFLTIIVPTYILLLNNRANHVFYSYFILFGAYLAIFFISKKFYI